MKNFLAVYTGNAASRQRSDFDKLDEQERQKRQAQGIKAWKDWMSDHGTSLVFAGGPLGKTKRVGPEGVTDIRNNLVGYVVVQAESHEAAARMFEKHPHFTIFPGESVEVMECPPIPGAS
jgi:hypothetical protein